VGEEGVETLLAASIDAARRGGVIQKSSAQQVIVDTTVMPKAIAHPTDSRLLDKSRQHLVKVAEDNGLQLRQNYNRVAPLGCADRALRACQAVQTHEESCEDTMHPRGPSAS
jgi:IS5 family transposase